MSRENNGLIMEQPLYDVLGKVLHELDQEQTILFGDNWLGSPHEDKEYFLERYLCGFTAGVIKNIFEDRLNTTVDREI